jgi:NAD(P)-dependent dehydrogenase (short-subunit alcohol dehydrogenase family)
MQIDLTGKTALVTGSSAVGGIGYATAAGLHASGATVVINGHTTDRVQEAVDALGAGDRVIDIAADVSTARGCEALIGAVPHVDILCTTPVEQRRTRRWRSPMLSGRTSSRLT